MATTDANVDIMPVNGQVYVTSSGANLMTAALGSQGGDVKLSHFILLNIPIDKVPSAVKTILDADPGYVDCIHTYTESIGEVDAVSQVTLHGREYMEVYVYLPGNFGSLKSYLPLSTKIRSSLDNLLDIELYKESVDEDDAGMMACCGDFKQLASLDNESFSFNAIVIIGKKSDGANLPYAIYFPQQGAQPISKYAVSEGSTVVQSGNSMGFRIRLTLSSTDTAAEAVSYTDDSGDVFSLSVYTDLMSRMEKGYADIIDTTANISSLSADMRILREVLPSSNDIDTLKERVSSLEDVLGNGNTLDASARAAIFNSIQTLSDKFNAIIAGELGPVLNVSPHIDAGDRISIEDSGSVYMISNTACTYDNVLPESRITESTGSVSISSLLQSIDSSDAGSVFLSIAASGTFEVTVPSDRPAGSIIDIYVKQDDTAISPQISIIVGDDTSNPFVSSLATQSIVRIVYTGDPTTPVVTRTIACSETRMAGSLETEFVRESSIQSLIRTRSLTDSKTYGVILDGRNTCTESPWASGYPRLIVKAISSRSLDHAGTLFLKPSSGNANPLSSIVDIFIDSSHTIVPLNRKWGRISYFMDKDVASSEVSNLMSSRTYLISPEDTHNAITYMPDVLNKTSDFFGTYRAHRAFTYSTTVGRECIHPTSYNNNEVIRGAGHYPADKTSWDDVSAHISINAADPRAYIIFSGNFISMDGVLEDVVVDNCFGVTVHDGVGVIIVDSADVVVEGCNTTTPVMVLDSENVHLTNSSGVALMDVKRVSISNSEDINLKGVRNADIRNARNVMLDYSDVLSKDSTFNPRITIHGNASRIYDKPSYDDISGAIAIDYYGDGSGDQAYRVVMKKVSNSITNTLQTLPNSN